MTKKESGDAASMHPIVTESYNCDTCRCRHKMGTECPMLDIPKAARELEMRRSFMQRLPFCPDHRDKVREKECRECEIERLQGLIRQVIQGNWCVTDLQEAIGDL